MAVSFFTARMHVIEAYGTEHLLVVLVLAASAFLAALLLSRASVSKAAVLVSCGLILLALEIVKQPLLTYVRGGVYSWSDFPWQLCSIPMYLCILYAFLKKWRSAIEEFLMTFGFIGAVAAFAVPYSSFTSYVLLTFQSLIWHAILLFMAFYLLMKKGSGSHSFCGAALLYLGAAVLASAFNLATYRVSGGTSNMFFFGPGNPDIGILNLIQEKAGWAVETVAMMAATELAGFLMHMAEILLRKKNN